MFSFLVVAADVVQCGAGVCIVIRIVGVVYVVGEICAGVAL